MKSQPRRSSSTGEQTSILKRTVWEVQYQFDTLCNTLELLAAEYSNLTTCYDSDDEIDFVAANSLLAQSTLEQELQDFISLLQDDSVKYILLKRDLYKQDVIRRNQQVTRKSLRLNESVNFEEQYGALKAHRVDYFLNSIMLYGLYNHAVVDTPKGVLLLILKNIRRLLEVVHLPILQKPSVYNPVHRLINFIVQRYHTEKSDDVDNSVDFKYRIEIGKRKNHYQLNFI